MCPGNATSSKKFAQSERVIHPRQKRASRIDHLIRWASMGFLCSIFGPVWTHLAGTHLAGTEVERYDSPRRLRFVF